MRHAVLEWIEGLRGPRITALEIRVICAMCLFMVPIALATVLLFEYDLRQTADAPGLGADFPQFYMAGWFLNHHAPSELYDLQRQMRVPDEIRPAIPGVMFPYLYPPFLAVAFRPLALLPYSAAFVCWTLVSLGLYIAGLLTLLHRLPLRGRVDMEMALLLALAFEPFIAETLAGGQVSAIAFVALALAISLDQQSRPFRCGVALSVCLYKPTLLLLVVPMLFLSRRWKTVAGFATGAAILFAGTVFAVGFLAIEDYVRAMFEVGQFYMRNEGVLRTWKYIDVRSATILLTGWPAMGIAVLLAAALAATPFLLRAWSRGRDAHEPYPTWTWALTLSCTLLVNGYVPIYDGILLVLVLVLIAVPAGVDSSNGRRGAYRWLVFLAFVAGWISQPIARATGVQVFTILLVLVVLYIVTASRRSQLGTIPRLSV